jgi:hypothetical protein
MAPCMPDRRHSCTVVRQYGYGYGYGYEYEYGNFLRAAVRCAWNPPRNLAYAPRNLAYAHANLLGCIYVCFGCSSLFLAG